MSAGLSSFNPAKRIRLKVALVDLPGSHAMQEVIRAKWRLVRPDVDLEFATWDSYKTDPPAELDVFEYDALFLDDLADRKLIAPLSPDELADRDDFLAFALDGARARGSSYGIPRIACTPVLFYRKGDTEVERVTSLKGLLKVVGVSKDDQIRPPRNKGLLIDLSGGTTCACYYLDAVALTRGEYPPASELAREGTLDRQAIANLRMLTRMAGKMQASFDDAETKYAQRAEWFGNGFGRVFVGWTERLSVMPVEKHAAISFRPFPVAESKAVNLLSVDLLSINPRLDAGRRKIAVEFANFAASKEVVIATFLVKNAMTRSPQYLLPVRKSVLSDRQFLADAPLYARLAQTENGTAKSFRIGSESRTWFQTTKKAIQKAIFEID